MGKELSVVLAGEDRELGKVLDEIRKIKFVPIRVELVSLPNLKQAITRTHPHLVIYDTGSNLDSMRKIVATVSDEFPAIHWAVVSKMTDVDMVLDFFRMGAADYLKVPVEGEDIKRLIQKTVERENKRDSNGNEQTHRTIALFSPKGGVGLTTLATNLAVELARNKAGKILLLDLVLQHGNVGDVLDLPSQYSILNVIEDFERLDSNLLENSLAKHPAGFYVLPCPKQPEDEDFVSSKQMTEIFQFFKGVFQYVIADVGHEFSKIAISYLDLADMVLLVTTPDVPSLCNTRSALNTFQRLGYSQDKVKVVLNRWQMKGAIDPQTIQKNLPVGLFCRISDDQAVCLAAHNQGRPVRDVQKSGDLVKSFERLTSMVTAPAKVTVPVKNGATNGAS